jgi:hypothetical protein
MQCTKRIRSWGFSNSLTNGCRLGMLTTTSSPFEPPSSSISVFFSSWWMPQGDRTSDSHCLLVQKQHAVAVYRWLAFTFCFPSRLAKLGVCWPVGPNRRLHGNHMHIRLLKLRSQVFLACYEPLGNNNANRERQCTSQQLGVPVITKKKKISVRGQGAAQTIHNTTPISRVTLPP